MTLSKRLEGGISKHKKYSISYGISLGLQYLCSQTLPIVHCDLTCNNVLLTSNNVAKIADLSYIFKPDPANNDQWMTPGNMPPKAMDKQFCDISSFGNILQHMFTQELKEFLSTESDDDENQLRSKAEQRQHLLATFEHDMAEFKKIVTGCIDNNQQKHPKIDVLVEFFKNELVTSAIYHKIQLFQTVLKKITNALQDISAETHDRPVVIQFVNSLKQLLAIGKDSDIKSKIVSHIVKTNSIMQEQTVDEMSLCDHLEYIFKSQFVRTLSSLMKKLQVLEEFITTAKDIGNYILQLLC